MSVAPGLPGTATDLERLSAEGRRFELIAGELQQMSPVGGKQGSASIDLGTEVNYYVRRGRLGRCFAAETGFLLAQDPDTVLAPDLAFIRRDRLPEVLPDGWVPREPDLVLETRSAHDSEREIREKVELWLSYGVQVVWDLDPKRRRLTLYRQGEAPEVLGPAEVLREPELLPGFSLALQELF